MDAGLGEPLLRDDRPRKTLGWALALRIDIDGTKHPLAVVEGSTENATLVTDLCVGLRERGLDVTRPVLAVLDGSKALRRAVADVFDHPGHRSVPAAQDPQREGASPATHEKDKLVERPDDESGGDQQVA